MVKQPSLTGFELKLTPIGTAVSSAAYSFVSKSGNHNKISNSKQAITKPTLNIVALPIPGACCMRYTGCIASMFSVDKGS